MPALLTPIPRPLSRHLYGGHPKALEEGELTFADFAEYC